MTVTKIKIPHYIYLIPLLTFLWGCRKDDVVIPAEYDIITETPASGTSIKGFYLVNEGNMGSNKCTLDYFDYFTGVYSRNIYAERNPNVVKELGDVGNDVGIYGSKLYIVVNCSNKVEVLDSNSGIRIGQIDIPNCRNICFFEGKAYISSYVGPVHVDINSPKGAVYEVDTLSLAVTDRVTVGYQPEEMAIVDGYMYVANSGGYRAPEYDNTLSVIRVDDFKQVQQITVATNPAKVKKDKYDRLWVTALGDRLTEPASLYLLSKKSGQTRMSVEKKFDIPCADFAIKDDLLYYYTTREFYNNLSDGTVSYGVIDISTLEKVTDNFITDGTEKDIAKPYGVAIHPETGDILLTDAKNYVSSGTLYCFDKEGKKKWSVRTGDIPAHICFLTK